MRSLPVLLTIAFLLLLTCGCSESPPAQPTVTATSAPATPSLVITTIPTPVIPVITPSRTASVSDNTINITKNTFDPATMTVKVNSTVRWVNKDDHPHTIEFMNKAFTTSILLLGAGQSGASLPFNRPGLYNYSCTIHPTMHGTITVEA